MSTTTAKPPTRTDGKTNYFYKVRNTDGTTRTGTGRFASEEALIEKLLSDPKIRSVLKVRGGGGANESQSKARPKNRSLIQFARQFAICLEVGMQDKEALDMIRANDSIDDLALKRGLDKLSADIDREGEAIGVAMQRQPYVFPALMTQTLIASLATSKTREAADQIANDLEHEDDRRAQMKKASTYPTVVLAVSSLIFIFMMAYVVPQFGSLYSNMGRGEVKLPALTVLVISISDQMAWMLPTFAIALTAAVFWYRRNSQEMKVREVVDPLKMKMPIFGELFRKVALTRFCRTLSTLSENKVHNVDALIITAAAVNNVPMERACLKAAEALRNGEAMMTPFTEEPLFPKFLVSFIAIGDSTGKMHKALAPVGRLYGRDVDGITNNMSALIEPIFLMILAAMVGVIALAVYLPYFQIGDLFGTGY